MNAKKIFLVTAFSLAAFKVIPPPINLIFNESKPSRTPAEEKINNTKIEIDYAKEKSSTCHAEIEGEKLKVEIADLLKDKELILKQIDSLKVENVNLKASAKKKNTANSDEIPPLENSATLLLMTQMTNLFSTQMQMQMQMQNQMLLMISQLQNNIIDETNFKRRLPTLSESIDLNSKNVGITYPQFKGNYGQNPYSSMPILIPQQNIPGYDFDQSNNIDLQKVPMTVQSFSF